METEKQNWTKEELHAYLLIYSMNADYNESSNELEVVKAKVGADVFKKMHEEFNADNDYQSIQKVQNAIKDLGYSKDEVANFFTEIKELFLSDGDYDILERNLMLGLKRLLA